MRPNSMHFKVTPALHAALMWPLLHFALCSSVYTLPTQVFAERWQASVLSMLGVDGVAKNVWPLKKVDNGVVTMQSVRVVGGLPVSQPGDRHRARVTVINWRGWFMAAEGCVTCLQQIGAVHDRDTGLARWRGLADGLHRATSVSRFTQAQFRSTSGSSQCFVHK
ncbi:hypothetical protein J6590_042850 [Homalodisca vitripennis]|nr:hypothetical protein J6590_042850 [Homalodisca vitripennis]